MIKPTVLKPGDTIATVSLSWGGPGAFPRRYEAGKRQLAAAFDLNVVEMPHTLREPDWLWRNPQARADDLMAAFADPAINGIISTIGGDDSLRLLPYLDIDIIRANPKVFLGYSDTTISHLACFKAGLVSFYGPAIMAGFAENGGLFPYLVEAVRRTLFSVEPVGEILPNQAGWTVERLKWGHPAHQSRPRKLQPSTGWRWLQGQGCSEGHLLGGCIEVLDWLRGTPFWPSLAQWEGAILFLETSEEAPTPTQVKYLLRTYAALGILPRLSGLLFGRPGGSDLSPEMFGEYDAVIRSVVAEEAGLPELPIITQMDFGHTDPMFVLPYGVKAVIDADARRFSIIEAAVGR